jgi:hypothetical protein
VEWHALMMTGKTNPASATIGFKAIMLRWCMLEPLPV